MSFRTHSDSFQIETRGKGTYEITDRVADIVHRSGVASGTVTVFIQHTSASLIIYENDQVWRSIWTDGRAFPGITEPRWYGYSVGKWMDDYTFVVDTVGLDERTWLDNAGDPHSDQMRVEETYHRVDQNTLELTVKIDDPKAYKEPWFGLKNFALHRQSAGFDIREMICAPSEAEEYKKQVAEPATR